jgi:serine/threonine protein phosphatase 1
MGAVMQEYTYINECDYNRIIAVGDIHGYWKPVEALLKKINLTGTDLLIFIGDYIDRGPDSKQVVEELIRLSDLSSNVLFLKGNHEDMLLGSMGIDAVVKDVSTWLYNGGHATLTSYGMGRNEIEQLQRIWEEGVRFQLMKEYIPDSHIDFYSNLNLYIESERFFFCHAGISPYGTVEEGKNNLQDLLWIRDHLSMIDPPWEKTVVCGHTPLREVLLEDRLICIDTGLYYYGQLSAIDVLTRELYQVGEKE